MDGGFVGGGLSDRHLDGGLSDRQLDGGLAAQHVMVPRIVDEVTPVPQKATKMVTKRKKTGTDRKTGNDKRSFAIAKKKRKQVTLTQGGTPVKKRKKDAFVTPLSPQERSVLSRLPAGKPSPFLMKCGRRCHGCDHDNKTGRGWAPVNSKKAWTKSASFRPTKCTHCGSHCSQCNIFDTNEFVFCNNACNHEDHGCTWAICGACKQKRHCQISGRPTRSRAAGRFLNMGGPPQKGG